MTTSDTGSPSEGAPTTQKEQKEGGNSKRGNWQQRSGNKSVTIPRQPKFEGKSDDLKGHIYDCSDARQADQFAKTTKEIAEYVGRTYTYGGDARLAIENLTIPVAPEPEDPPADATKTRKLIWKKKVEEYVKRESYMQDNIKIIFSLVWGQCSDIMRQLESLDNFSTISAEGDGLKLLKAIKNLNFSFQSQKYMPHSLHEAKRHFYLFSQGKQDTVAYYEQYLNIIEVIETIKGSIGIDPGTELLIAEERNKTVDELTQAEKEEAQQRYLAVAFILGADRSRFGKLIENLENMVNEDPCTIQIHGYTALGLMEMTRQRRTPTLYERVGYMFEDE